MITPAQAHAQAEVLRRAARESVLSPVAGRLAHQANEFAAAAEYCTIGYAIVHVSQVLTRQRVVTIDGERGQVTGVFTKDVNGTVTVKVLTDKPDPATGGCERWLEYVNLASPIVVEAVAEPSESPDPFEDWTPEDDETPGAWT